MNKLRFFLYLLFFPFINLPINSIFADHAITINIISHSLNNGAGKEVDVAILKDEFEKLGHQVNLFDYFVVDRASRADINIFLAQFKPEWFSKAKLNWFIPNPECLDAKVEDLENFDLVLCKTKETLKIFEPISKEVYYLGFTSIDCLNPAPTKNYSHHLHVAGKSRMKGTESIFNVWKSDSTLPKLTMIRHSRTKKIIHAPRNLKVINNRISRNSLLSLQNNCGIHLCPSKTEGFGHYIMEAMSTEAVVITTNAPPMNEFIQDGRCLVKYKSKGKKNFGTTYNVDEKELAKTVRQLQQLSSEEMQSIGRLNRKEYLRRTAEFKENLEKLMKKTVQNL